MVAIKRLAVLIVASALCACSSPGNPPAGGLAEALETGKYEACWAAGSANQVDDAKTTTLPVEITVEGNRVVIAYPYFEGRMEGTIKGSEIEGTWTQNGPGARFNGDFYLKFSEDSAEGQGWWRDAQEGKKHKASLKRVEVANPQSS